MQPAFNGTLGPESDPQWGTLGHGFFVTRAAPTDLGTETARFPTADGHELVVHATPGGVAAVVHYGGWWLVADWDQTPSGWAPFAAALNATETADGYLVITPAVSGWKLGPADTPELQLGGAFYGSGAAYTFWGPDIYPAGCPSAGEETRTAQGWPVSLENGAWWCDTGHGRSASRCGTRVSSVLPSPACASRTPTRNTPSIASPRSTGRRTRSPRLASVLDHLVVQATIAVDGLDTPAPIVVNATRDVPDRFTPPDYSSADGHRLVVVRSRAR